MNAGQLEHLKQGDDLYERYGKPLEADHWGEYLVIMPDGRTILGETPIDAGHQAVRTFGRGGYLFKVGDRVVYRLR